MHESFLDPEGIVNPSLGSPAWTKACAGCAMRKGDPQELGHDVQNDLKDEARSGWLTFYCVHRRDDTGRHRECASGDALRRGACRSSRGDRR